MGCEEWRLNDAIYGMSAVYVRAAMKSHNLLTSELKLTNAKMIQKIFEYTIYV